MKRRDLIKAVMSVVALHAVAKPTLLTAAPQPSLMPVLFIGHGSPMNAVQDNPFTRHLTQLGQTLPTPRAILVVSAHWVDNAPTLSAVSKPETIYDFGGFPQALYDIRYPCDGHPELATQIADTLSQYQAGVNPTRGLDHGAWTVLHHLYPNAEIPVLQLAMGAGMYMHEHLELASALQQLRREGVLILASGNIVHNLRQTDRSDNPVTPSWAEDFDALIKEGLLDRNIPELLARDKTKHSLWGKSHPTIEHYVPLLYALGASTESDTIQFPHEGFQAGSISMRSVLFG